MAIAKKNAKDRERIIAQMVRYHGSDEERAEALDEIVSENRPLITYFIQKNYPTYAKTDYFPDLLQCGTIGLIECLERFDPTKADLSTFAEKYVIHRLSEYVNDFIRGVRQHYGRNIHRVKAAVERLNRKGNDNPSVTDIAIEADMSTSEVSRAMKIAVRSDTVSYDSEGVLSSMVSDVSENPHDKYESTETIEALYAALNGLTSDERRIILMRHSLGPYADQKPIPNKDIAEKLDIPLSSVRGLYSSAMRKLKDDPKLASMFPSSGKKKTDYVSVVPVGSAMKEMDAMLEAEDDAAPFVPDPIKIGTDFGLE